jgi:hypothetical protein
MSGRDLETNKLTLLTSTHAWPDSRGQNQVTYFSFQVRLPGLDADSLFLLQYLP